jgi:hypothetical protein
MKERQDEWKLATQSTSLGQPVGRFNQRTILSTVETEDYFVSKE